MLWWRYWERRGTRWLATVTDESGFKAQAGRIICVRIKFSGSVTMMMLMRGKIYYYEF